MGRAEDLLQVLQKEGAAAIDRFIADKKAESFWLDFKRVDPAWSSKSLGNDNQKNYARAVGGFANSDGGLIVWGVDCSKKSGDVASAKHPIRDAELFVALLEDAVSRCTTPPVRAGVLNFVIPDPSSPGVGFPVSYIPKSEDSPHQELQTLDFYHRAGSAFAKMHYSVLAGQFGRRPSPSIELTTSKIEYRFGRLRGGRPWLTLHIFLELCNKGSGIARDYYICAGLCEGSYYKTGPEEAPASLSLI